MLCGAAEYDELPVRHNEDKLNMSLSAEVRFPIDVRSADDPHAKANLLLQVRFHLHTRDLSALHGPTCCSPLVHLSCALGFSQGVHQGVGVGGGRINDPES